MSLFYNFNESRVVEVVTMKWPSDEYVIPAGTPMSRTGIANDGNAIGILARDAKIEFTYPLSIAHLVGKKEPKGNKDFTFAIITGGFVNLSEAETAFGGKISDEAKAAMANINFVDDTAPNSFGGGGSGGGVFTAIIRCDSEMAAIKDCQPSDFYFTNTTGSEVIEKMAAGEFVNVLLYRPFVYGGNTTTYNPSMQTCCFNSGERLYMWFREYVGTDDVILYWNADENTFELGE